MLNKISSRVFVKISSSVAISTFLITPSPLIGQDKYTDGTSAIFRQPQNKFLLDFSN
jgi:hypothetical protein